ncbi:MAG TPA: SRPBCC family protein [Solirubrobacteraceae bacterium]|nr:SRPBCC family protein [Solirubrobacteraceae bacterium]
MRKLTPSGSDNGFAGPRKLRFSFAMSTVCASIDIAAAPELVWETVMDPMRLGDWVTIHRKLRHHDDGPLRQGYHMDQQIHMRGVSVDVHWTLVQCLAQERAVWEGRGPARSRARTEYALHPLSGGCTRFDYRNEFHAPLGPLGAFASRALVGGMPEREATRTLERLRTLLED